MEDYNEMYRPNPHCPVLDVDGVIANGKQFDLDISLPDVNQKKYQNNKKH